MVHLQCTLFKLFSPNNTIHIQYFVNFQKAIYSAFIKFSKINIFGIWSIFTIRCNSDTGPDALRALLADQPQPPTAVQTIHSQSSISVSSSQAGLGPRSHPMRSPLASPVSSVTSPGPGRGWSGLFKAEQS